MARLTLGSAHITTTRAHHLLPHPQVARRVEEEEQKQQWEGGRVPPTPRPGDGPAMSVGGQSVLILGREELKPISWSLAGGWSEAIEGACS